MKRTANHGEWAEVYVFLKLLLEGEVELLPTNDLLEPKRKVSFLELIRDDSSGVKVFKTREQNYPNSDELVTRAEISEATTELEKSLATKSGSYEIPAVERLLNRLGLRNIKAASNEKIDLIAKVALGNNFVPAKLGFSIKSDLGSASTLLNASGHTLFRFGITGGDGSDVMNMSTSSVRSLVSKIDEAGFRVVHLGPVSEKFSRNMSFFGESLPKMFSILTWNYYAGKGKALDRLIGTLEQGPVDVEIAQYQIGQFLKAIALGMTPGTSWGGEVSAYGGYLVLNKKRELVLVPATNEDLFRKYLLQNSFLDTPSTSRHKFGKIQKIENGLFLDLSLQIRFSA